MLDLLSTIIFGVVAICIGGFLSVKYFCWGAVATGVFTVIFTVLPSFDGSRPIDLMVPRLLGFATLYPRAIEGAAGQQWDAMGWAGLFGVLVAAVILFPPYIVGIWAGLKFWPELLFLRAGWAVISP